MEGFFAESTASDFVADAYAHCKFIGFVAAAEPIFAKAGIASLDEGCIALANSKDVTDFVKRLGELRLWWREPLVKMSEVGQRLAPAINTTSATARDEIRGFRPTSSMPIPITLCAT